MELLGFGGYPQGRLARHGRLPFFNALAFAPGRSSPGGLPAAAAALLCHSPFFFVVALTDYRLIGGVRFGVASGRVFFCVFFFVFSCLVCFFFVFLCFQINQLCASPRLFLPPPPSSPPWGFRLFAVCSPALWSASPVVAGRRLRPALRRRVPPSLAPWSVAVFAGGRSRGRWLVWSRRRGVCSLGRVAFLLAVASCLCFLNFF